MPVKLNSSGGGSITLDVPSMTTANTLTLPAKTGNIVTTADTGTVTPTMQSQWLTSSTVQNASGTAVDFTGIPSWAKRVTIMMNSVSLTGGTAHILFQIGSGSVTSSGYSSGSGYQNPGTGQSNSIANTSGFVVFVANSTAPVTGTAVINLLAANTYVCSGVGTYENASAIVTFAGKVALSGALDRVRITTNAADTFDAGSVNIMYEG